MSKTNEAWTTTHDLALLYVALAYGTDYQLSEAELNSINEALQGWCEGCDRETLQEIVVEAMAVFMEEEPEREVVNAMQSLKVSLPAEERVRALEEIVRIAESDGVLLRSERSLISTLATVWEVKSAGEQLVGKSESRSEDGSGWTLLHDMGLIYVVVAHSTDSDLSEPELSAMIERLLQWQPDFSEEDVRRVLRDVLQFYAGEPDKDDLRKSILALDESLPMLQRLALLDDLVYIAEADGDFSAHERDMILTISKAWNLSVRFNGATPRA